MLSPECSNLDKQTLEIKSKSYFSVERLQIGICEYLDHLNSFTIYSVTESDYLRILVSDFYFHPKMMSFLI